MKPLWIPSEQMKSHSRLNDYRAWLAKHYHVQFAEYKDLWEWSIQDISRFWESLMRYFEIDYSGSYEEVAAGKMPGTRWFEGVDLNYAEHIFRNKKAGDPGIFWRDERGRERTLNWEEIRRETARLRKFLLEAGVQKGDRVGGFLPNIPEATIGFLAASSIGAIWSSCSPDFGAESVIDRLAQVEPKVLLAGDGYTYSGKPYDKMEVVQKIVGAIPSIERVVLIPFLKEQKEIQRPDERYIFWDELPKASSEELQFVRVPFGHPIWVLYSSGTTGKPKAITHGHGGVLLEHMKYLAFNND